jgi:hypothetical protein
VIVIPGILGSNLVDRESGRTVWGAFAGGAVTPKTAEGARLVALPMQEGASLHELKDEVVSNGALERLNISLLGLPLRLNAYIHILRALGAGGYRDQQLGEAGAIDYGDTHFTCFQFGYDWRRDLQESAAQLHDFILKKRAYVQRELERRFGIKDAEVKFDLVGHSMGGLLARYYLRYGPRPLPEDGSVPQVTWEGAKYVERVVMIGTPNAGSAEALVNLVEGFQLAPFLPAYPPEVVGTMPALYQLLPHRVPSAVVDARDEKTPVDILDPAV